MTYTLFILFKLRSYKNSYSRMALDESERSPGRLTSGSSKSTWKRQGCGFPISLGSSVKCQHICCDSCVIANYDNKKTKTKKMINSKYSFVQVV